MLHPVDFEMEMEKLLKPTHRVFKGDSDRAIVLIDSCRLILPKSIVPLTHIAAYCCVSSDWNRRIKTNSCTLTILDFSLTYTDHTGERKIITYIIKDSFWLNLKNWIFDKCPVLKSLKSKNNVWDLRDGWYGCKSFINTTQKQTVAGSSNMVS